MRARLRFVPLLLASAAVVSCGKKGPPLAPLRLVPEAPAALTAARLGPDVHLRFTLPSKNAGGPGPVELDHVEIYAVSLAPGAVTPPNREFLTAKYLVGTIDVKTPPPPGAPAEDPGAPDTRPGPGEVAAFVEPLTRDMLNPPPPEPPPAAAAADPAAPPAAAAAATPTYPVRIYAVRGITRGGRPGPPTTRATVPLVDPPAAPTSVAAAFTASAFVLSWLPPVGDVGAAPLLFNVYRAEAPSLPLNAKPIAEATFEHPGVEFGTERCFSVRTITMRGDVPVASEASVPACVTPTDIFPPAAPAGLTGVPSPGVIALIWDANPEPDLAGYLVLRGEAAGDTLQPLTPEPITTTAYRDTAVTPGVRYVYVVVAVDRATPPNTSAHSTRVEVTAAQ
jgi:hypothetical protein